MIISVNGKQAVSALETMDQVAEIRPGSVIPIVVMRDDKKMTMQVTVQEISGIKLSRKSKGAIGPFVVFKMYRAYFINELFAQLNIFAQRPSIPSSACCP